MTRRIAWLDIAKGISIILMVIGHTSIPAVFSNFIWAFHMPIFFIASGLSTDWNKTGVYSYFIRKIRALMLPFLVYSLTVLLILSSLGWVSFFDWLIHGWGGYALWFIPVLFLSSLLAKLISLIEKRLLLTFVVIALVLASSVLSFFKIQLVWSLSVVPYATALIILGSKLSRFSGLIERSRLWQIIPFALIVCIVSRYYRLDLCYNSVLPLLPHLLSLLAGTIMIFILSFGLDKYSKKASTLLKNVGKETYLIVAFSQVIIMLLNEYYALHTILKYSILLFSLIVLKHIKDGVNKLAKANIL